jgi:hypothetical protein
MAEAVMGGSMSIGNAEHINGFVRPRFRLSWFDVIISAQILYDDSTAIHFVRFS